MKPSSRTLIAMLYFCVAAPSPALTVNVGGIAADGTLVSVGEDWRYFKGTSVPSAPLDEWRGVGFDDSGWLVGATGIGYDDGDDATVLEDMEGSYRAVYTRKAFSLGEVPDGQLELAIDYDDGFVAYVNGVEVARSSNMAGQDVAAVTTFSSHEAGGAETFVLGPASDLLRAGANVLAIEGHNNQLNSSDFSLIPELRVVAGGGAIVRDGGRFIVIGSTVDVGGTADEAGTVEVRVNGLAAGFDAGTGTWNAPLALAAGINRVTVDAVDAAGGVLATESVEVVGVPSANIVGGRLDAAATWSGAVLLDADVTVPEGLALSVEAGTIVMARDGVQLVVNGSLTAVGTEEAPIEFTHFGDGTTWGRILMIQAEPSRLSHCVVAYSDCEGDHKDYYDDDCDDATPPPGNRDYFQAVVAVASHVDIDHCLFENLPDAGANAEGDAIAIIADDPDFPGIATATIRDCRFIGIGQGIHTRFAPIVVQGCFFTGHNGDNDDIDLYGESDPVPLILNNILIDPGHDDMINPTRCSAILVGNIVAGSDDHGIVLRDRSRPVLINNLIYDCSAAAISVQNQCDALLINNTLANCGRGVRFFDHTSRRGPPYCLFPGSGKATLINCIIQDCNTTFDLEDSPWEGDPGSHITVRHCLVDGGEGAASVSSNSTLTWLEGNIDADALFVDEAAERLRLQSAAGRWDELAEVWVQDATTSPAVDAGIDLRSEYPELAQWLGGDFDGVARPLDGDADGSADVDLGAYELVAERADSRGDAIADGWLFHNAHDLGDPDIATKDTDGDGRTTAEEFAALTDPRDPASFFAAAVHDVGGGLARVAVEGAIGRTYSLYRSKDLLTWEAVVVAVAGTGSEQFLEDSDAAGDWFYRVRVSD